MRLLFAAVFIAFALYPICAAGAEKTHLQYYKAYNAALEAGDFEAAATEGEAAWRAAEIELGDVQTTAVLAYNYASLIYFRRPEQAIEPLERVVEIAGADNEIFGDEAPGLMLSLVKAVSDNENKDAKKHLLGQLESPTVAPSLLSARGWIHLSTYELQRKRFKKSFKNATIALEQYEPYRNEVPLEVATAYITRGVANIAGFSRKDDEIIQANQDFIEAVSLFPPQVDIETFDPLLATAVAWNLVSKSAAHADHPDRPRAGSRLKDKPLELDPIENIKWTTPRYPYEGCGLEWKSRPAPKYPNTDSYKGYLGGVLIGYHFDGTKVTGARILAEVPEQSQFGEATLKILERWELKAPPAEECRRDRLTSVVFTFD